MNWLLVALFGYLAVQVGIGFWAAKRVQTEADYLVAGRGLGYPLTIFSVFATWFGAESCIASAARVYQNGFTLTTAEPIAYGLCLVLMGLVFAVPLWRRRLTTFADLFRERYGPGVERTAALIMVPSSIFWAAAQLRGFGQVLTTVTTLDTTIAIGLAAAFCVAYTMLGGLLADVITDLVQGIVIVIGLVVLAVLVIMRRGGLAATLDTIDTARIAVTDPATTMTALGVLEEWAIPIIGSVVAVEMVSRVIAARSPQVARNGTVLAGGMYIAVGLVPVFIGLAAVGIGPGPEAGERFLPALALAILPPALYVLLAGALISAILSTVNTILLVSAGLISHNVIAPALGIESDRRRLLMARVGVVVFGLIAWIMAVRAEGIAALVEEASAFGSAGIVVVTCFGLFSSRGGSRTALITLVGALAVYLAAAWGEVPYPFLTSLAAALALYLGSMAFE